MTTVVSADFEGHISCLIVAIEFYPQMAIKMIKDTVNDVLEKLENDNGKFMDTLNKSEKVLIKKLSTDGFENFDISLLYKLIRHFSLVPGASKKWRKGSSLATNTTQEDDMERMRINRNSVIHRPKVNLPRKERDEFFRESIEIACRLDKVIGDSSGSFETKIRNAKIYSITQDQSRQALEKCPELQEQLKNIHLYYGDVIAVILRRQDLPATGSTQYTIYIRGENIDDPAIRERLEQLKKSLNEGSCEIKLLETESGSLVLHVEITNLCFKTKDSLHKAIAEFLQRVFTSINGSLDQHIMEVVLTECDSYIISDNEEENDDYSNNQESLVLKLDGMAMTSQHVDEGAKLLDDKDARATQEDKTCGILTYSLSQGTSHGKNPEEAFGSKVKSEKGPKENKNKTVTKQFIKEEKMLILSSYISLTKKTDWDQLVDIVYKECKNTFPEDMIKHYENLYACEGNKLQHRIKGFIQKVQYGNETDPEIMALVEKVQSITPVASPKGQR